MTALANTGTMELRDSYQKNLGGGLLTAGLFHTMIVAALMVNTSVERINVGTISCGPRTGETILSIKNYILQPANPPKFAVNKNGIGIPVPIPDPEIGPEGTIPEEEQSISTNGNGKGFTDEREIGTGTSEGGSVYGNTEETPPKDFTPGVEKFPIAISNPAPAYPDIARRSGVEGTVFIKMWVTKDGTVRTAEVVKSTSELFDQAAIEAAKLWKFTPALMNGRPVSVFVTVPFRFRLRLG